MAAAFEFVLDKARIYRLEYWMYVNVIFSSDITGLALLVSSSSWSLVTNCSETFNGMSPLRNHSCKEYFRDSLKTSLKPHMNVPVISG